MREGMGLYKAKRKDTGKWIQGYLFCIWEKAYILWGTTNGIPDMVEVDPDTVCKRTGLLDKNGVQIFEGDIVKHYDHIRAGEPDRFVIGEIYWDDKKCCYKRTSTCGSIYVIDNYCVYEVIGNIHDNEVEE